MDDIDPLAASVSLAIAVSPSASSSSRYANNPASDVTTDPRKLHHQATVKIQPDGTRFRFTRGVRHPHPPIQDLLIAVSESRRALPKSARHPGDTGLTLQHPLPSCGSL